MSSSEEESSIASSSVEETTEDSSEESSEESSDESGSSSGSSDGYGSSDDEDDFICELRYDTWKKDAKNFGVGKTMVEQWNTVLGKAAKRTALQAPGSGKGWRKWTWQQYYDESVAVARALIALGVDRRTGVNIVSFNCPEWFFAFWGGIFAGGFSTGVYTTNAPEQCQYVAEHSDAQVIFVEDQKQLDKYLEVWDDLPDVRALVLINGEPKKKKKNVYTYKDFIALGEKNREKTDKVVQKRISEIQPNHLLTLIYTSGTTGMPKGVKLSHENVRFQMDSVILLVKMKKKDRVISYLPLSHIAEQLFSMYGPMAEGSCTYFAKPDALKGSLVETLKKVRPTHFLGVPRVWEKMEAQMKAVGAANKGAKLKIAVWAKKKGLRAGRAKVYGYKGPGKVGLANKLVFSKVKAALGLNKSRYNVTGAAPIGTGTIDYFRSIGIEINEAYGMSESTGVTTLTRPGWRYTGWTGSAVPGAEVKIAEDDGEVLFRGPHIMSGYYKNPEATEEAIDEDGWLHSGDIGVLKTGKKVRQKLVKEDDLEWKGKGKDNLPEDNSKYLAITDRKKELLITAGGENIAPSVIEGKLRSLPAIEQACVIGDRQKYLVALLTIDRQRFKAEAKAAGSKAKEPEDGADDKKFNKYVWEQISEIVNPTMSPPQQIKKFVLLSEEWGPEEGDEPVLTPTMKLKRRVIYEVYDDEISELYGDDWLG